MFWTSTQRSKNLEFKHHLLLWYILGKGKKIQKSLEHRWTTLLMEGTYYDLMNHLACDSNPFSQLGPLAAD